MSLAATSNCRSSTAPLVVLASAQYVSQTTVTRLRNYVAQGGRILWLGNNLQYDQYGKPRSSNDSDYRYLYNSSRVSKMSLQGSGEGYDSYWPNQFALAGIVPPFATVANGSFVRGVEIRSTNEPGNSKLVFLANCFSTSAQFALQHDPTLTRFTDLITGLSADPNNISLPSNGIMLIRAEP